MVLYVALSAIAGSIASGFLGYLKQNNGFSFGKFLPTLIRSGIAGAGVAMASPFVNVTATNEVGIGMAMLAAFLAGAGVDSGLHKLAGTIQKKPE